MLYGATMRLRAAAYRRGLLPTQRLPLPAVAVGNLSVGGAGKTPLAAWIARHYAGRGRTPGILLRGYGADEPLVHRRLVPEGVVVADRNRAAGAAQARAAGADVLVLDDAFQLLAVARDLNIAVVSAESVAGSPWPLPAGPWREGWDALARADVIVVTRKHATADAATALARRLEAGEGKGGRTLLVCVAHLAVSQLEGMRSGATRDVEVNPDAGIPSTSESARRFGHDSPGANVACTESAELVHALEVVRPQSISPEPGSNSVTKFVRDSFVEACVLPIPAEVVSVD